MFAMSRRADPVVGALARALRSLHRIAEEEEEEEEEEAPRVHLEIFVSCIRCL